LLSSSSHHHQRYYASAVAATASAAQQKVKVSHRSFIVDEPTMMMHRSRASEPASSAKSSGCTCKKSRYVPKEYLQTYALPTASKNRITNHIDLYVL